MAKSEEFPHTTRRRVWRFVFGCLGVVLVVGLWPLKGYRLDTDQFAAGLGPPYFAGDYVEGEPRLESGGALGVAPTLEGIGYCSSLDLETSRASRVFLEVRRNRLRNEWPVGWKEFHEIEPNVFGWWVEFPDNGGLHVVGFAWPCRNILLEAEVLLDGRGDKSAERVIREAFGLVREGIDREIPGVTTFYNPPARQLWINIVQTFLYELELKRAAADGNLWEEFEESP